MDLQLLGVFEMSQVITPPKKREVGMSFRMDKQLYNVLFKLADENEVSVSYLIYDILYQHPAVQEKLKENNLQKN